MRRSLTLFLVLAASAAVAIGLLVGIARAQRVDGLDLQAARSRADARGAEEAAFAREVAKRGAEMAAQAADVAKTAARIRALPAGSHHAGANGIDLDALLASSDGALKAGQGTKPRFIAFVSLSMPPASLKQIMHDVGGAGGIVAFRGFPGNSARAFLAGVSKSVDKAVGLHGVGIDPRLFRAFDIAAVPTYVVMSADFQPCDDLHCQTELPPYDMLSGNVTASYALSAISGGGGPGAAVARIYLAALKRNDGQ